MSKRKKEHQNDRRNEDIQKYRWQTDANCQGKTSLMFPRYHKDITYINVAKQICQECTVQKQCLKEALEYHPIDMHGVWAGLTSRQLASEQKRLGIKPIKPSISQMWEL